MHAAICVKKLVRVYVCVCSHMPRIFVKETPKCITWTTLYKRPKWLADQDGRETSSHTLACLLILILQTCSSIQKIKVALK